MATFFEQQAQELYTIAKVKNCIDTVYADFQLFKEGVGGQMTFTQMMTNEAIGEEDKKRLIDTLNTFFTPETQSFFNEFVAQKHFDVIYRGVEYFEWLYHEHHITITSAVALTKEQVDRIMTKIAFKMKRTIDTVDTKIDEHIMGGIKVESQSFIVDSTITAQLHAFQQDMLRGEHRE